VSEGRTREFFAEAKILVWDDLGVLESIEDVEALDIVMRD
jgi:hypothetical protein